MAMAAEACNLGATVLWGAPTFSQCRIAWAEMYQAAGHLADFKVGNMEVVFPSGGRTIYKSLDNPDNARGYTADGLIVDEAPMVKERAWYEVLRPIISDTGGWAVLGGTPRGKNWYWREIQSSRDDPEAHAWSIPTLGVEITQSGLVRRPHPLENPGFPFSEAQRLYNTLPERIFRQEFLAEFIEDAGGVFRGVMKAATAGPQEKAKDGHAYVFGVDWGRYNDYTAITVIDVDTKEHVYMDRFSRVDYDFQVARLQAIYDAFRPSIVKPESNSMGGPLAERLTRIGMPIVPFNTTAETKRAAIQALSLAIERGDLRILNDPVLIGELQAFEMQRLPSGAFRYAAPSGMHDDTVMSLAIAWSAVSGQIDGPLVV